MHPIGVASECDILAFFERFGLQATDMSAQRSDPRLGVIAEVFPGFAGCVSAALHNPIDKARIPHEHDRPDLTHETNSRRPARTLGRRAAQRR
jgi:hypothetical protein